MEKLDNNNQLKIEYEKKVIEYDNLLVKIDRLKDKLFEITTNYNKNKEQKKKKYFNNRVFGLCAGFLAFIVAFCSILANFSLLESVAISFMTILLSCDGIFVVADISAERRLSSDVSLNMDKQTINQCEKYLDQLLNNKVVLKEERDCAWKKYSQSISEINDHVIETINNSVEITNNVSLENSGKKRVRTLEQN